MTNSLQYGVTVSVTTPCPPTVAPTRAGTDNAPMPQRPRRPDTTPDGRLSEAPLKRVIGYQLAQASVVVNQLYEHAVGEPMQLHRLEFSILTLVHENPGCTATSLAAALGISTPNMALWLDRVRGKGWIDRVPHEADRRASRLHLSADGEQTMQRAVQGVLDAEAVTLAALSEAERAMLAELLHKVAACRPAPRARR